MCWKHDLRQKRQKNLGENHDYRRATIYDNTTHSESCYPLWLPTNKSIAIFSVLVGSTSSFAEITKYIYMILLQNPLELKYKIE